MTAPPKRELVDVEGRPIPRSMPPGYLDEWLRELQALHVRILEERGGVPIDIDDVDAILDEMRGHVDPPGS